MADNKLTQEMKRYAVIVAIMAEHSNLQIVQFANRCVLPLLQLFEDNNGQISSVTKRKKHQQCSDSIRTLEFIQQVQNIIEESPHKSMRSIAKDLGVSEAAIQRTVHENL